MKKLAILIFSVIIVCGTFSNSAFAGLTINGVVSPGIAEVQMIDRPVILSVKGDQIGVDAVNLIMKSPQEISQLIAQNVSVTPSQKFSIEIGLTNLKCADYTVEVYDNEMNTLLETGTFRVILTASQGTLNEIAERVETIDENVEQELLPRTVAIQSTVEETLVPNTETIRE